MIDALVAGRLHAKPVERTSKNGKPYAVCTVRAASSQGDSVFADVVAFAEPVVHALLALDAGDSVALSGEVSVQGWLDKSGQPRAGLKLLACAIVTSYSVGHRRQAMRRPEASAPPVDLPFNDELPPMQAPA